MGLKTVYLVSYNLAMLAGWAATLATAVAYYAQKGFVFQRLYFAPGVLCPECSFAALLTASQLAMAIEPIHAALGLVRSPFFTSAIQVFSRLVVVLVLYYSPLPRTCIGVTLLTFAWSITEVVRYSYYALNTAGLKVPSFITYLRYTMFFVLYPMGVAGELTVLNAARPALPAGWNVPATFAVVFGYAVGFPKLYLYMISQRNKTLYGAPAAAADKKKKKAN